MYKNIIFILGIFLFVVGIVVNIRLRQDAQLAVARDGTKRAYGSISGDLLPCTWEVHTPERIMTENASQSILVPISGFDDERCESTISLRAPGFDMSPNKEEQTISLQPKGKGSLSWIVTPRKSGTYDIAISDMLNTRIFGVTVTNVFGLNAMQAQIASVLGSIFGPMMTVPWWWDKWRQRKKQNQEELPKKTG